MIKLKNRKKYWVIFISIILIIASYILYDSQNEEEPKIDYSYLLNQKLTVRDSLFFQYLFKEVKDNNTIDLGYVQDMYRVTKDQYKFDVAAVFYSPDKTKILAWVRIRYPNGSTYKIFNKDVPEAQKECGCPNKIMYGMEAFVGVRKKNGIWSLNRFDDASLGQCSESYVYLLDEYSRFFLRDMKYKSKEIVRQYGKKKGKSVWEMYRYNLQDKDFWDKCFIFKKDTVCSNNLYFYQIDGYKGAYDYENKYNKLAVPNPTTDSIKFPEEILKLYRD